MGPSSSIGAAMPDSRRPAVKGGRLPMAVWNGRPASLAAWRTAA